jgi:hypothetical protein
MEKKPNVFPKRETTNTPVMTEEQRLAAFEAEKAMATNEIYNTAVAPEDTPQGHMSAVEMMRYRTQQQLQQREEMGVVQDAALAEKTTTRVYQDQNQTKNEEQMRLRDEQLRKNMEQTQRFQQLTDEANNRVNTYTNTQNNMQQETYQNNYQNNQPPVTPPSKPPVNNGYGDSYGKNPSNIDPYILELSQPNYNAPFDVIPLPSQGKLYKNKKKNIRLAYMTTADENILTSPNLLESGQFLEILINRKILEPDLRYKDLTVGDRNAIMIWLRATGYGEMYPVTLLDGSQEAFDTEVNLNDLKTKYLGAEPDEDGLFSFTLPISKTELKFRLLTCGDLDDIEYMIEQDNERKIPVNNSTTYRFEKMIVEVNGNRDRTYLRDFASFMRIADAKALDNYIEQIESGIDLNIEVTTPGGGSVATFLPLNVSFFWPNFRV